MGTDKTSEISPENFSRTAAMSFPFEKPVNANTGSENEERTKLAHAPAPAGLWAPSTTISRPSISILCQRPGQRARLKSGARPLIGSPAFKTCFVQSDSAARAQTALLANQR